MQKPIQERIDFGIKGLLYLGPLKQGDYVAKKPKFKINYKQVSNVKRAAGLKMLCKVCNTLTSHAKPKTVGKWVGLFCGDCGAQNGVMPKGGPMNSYRCKIKFGKEFTA